LSRRRPARFAPPASATPAPLFYCSTIADPAAVPTISNHRSLLRHVQVGKGALDGLGCTRDGLAEGRVRMDGEPDVGGIAAGLHGERDLADQLAGVGAHDAAAEHAVAVGI